MDVYVPGGYEILLNRLDTFWKKYLVAMHGDKLAGIDIMSKSNNWRTIWGLRGMLLMSQVNVLL